jgi:hypothetical protein
MDRTKHVPSGSESNTASLDERKLDLESKVRERELQLKERELAGKELESSRSKWLNPTVLGLFAAAIALVGNIIVAAYNNRTSVALEKSKEESSLILQLIKPGDSQATCKGLNFFAGLHQLHLPADGLLSQCSLSNEIKSAPRQQPGEYTPIKYRILFEKSQNIVSVHYDLAVPTGGPALIASFHVAVDGIDLISGFSPGQVAFRGLQFHVLAHPNKDTPVSVSMSTNQGWNSSSADTLRGDESSDLVSLSH